MKMDARRVLSAFAGRGHRLRCPRLYGAGAWQRESRNVVRRWLAEGWERLRGV